MRFFATAFCWAILTLATGLSYPYASSTGSFDVASSVGAKWTSFLWKWSGQDYRDISAQFLFTEAAEASSIANVYFRLSYPERGPYFLQVSTGTITPSGTTLVWSTTSAIAPSNIPPDELYYAEFQGVSASGETRSLAKGRVQVDWSLFNQTNPASWTPISIVYAGSGTVSILESDPIFVAWQTNTWLGYTNTADGRLVALESFQTNQAGTNVVFDSSIASNTAFRETQQPATNVIFQDAFDALGTAATVDSTNFATAAQGVLGASAVQPTDAAYTSAVADAASAVQPTDAAYTSAVADAASALQSGDAGTWTNLSDYNDDLSSTDVPVQSVFGRTGDVVGVAGDYTDIYSPTGHTHVVGDVTGLQTALDAKSSTTAVALVEAKADQGVTAYEWGDHADEGYVTSVGTRLDSMTVADVTEISSNISGLTAGTYTGDVNSVSYTGSTAVAQNYVYVWGFTKQNNNGTGTLTLAGATVSATASGLVSNYFVALTAGTSLVLQIDGTGSAKSDVSGVFVRLITNGMVYAAEGVKAPTAIFEGLLLPVGSFTTGQVWTCVNSTTGEGDWGDAGAGDMLKSIYDVAGNGQVDDADDSDALGGVAAAGYATTGEVAALSNTVAGLTAVQRYAARTNSDEEIIVTATKAGVTASRTGTAITFDNSVGAIIQNMEIRWPVTSLGAEFSIILATNGLAHSSAATRLVANYDVFNDANGAPIVGASVRPDITHYDQLNVMGLLGANATIKLSL